MPLPIGKIKGENNETGFSGIDYSFLKNIGPVKKNGLEVLASNNDADLLVEIWNETEKVGDEIYKLKESSKISKDDIQRLKQRGLISEDNQKLSFTNRAKTIITTMALGENNKFLKDQKSKKYTEILASISVKGKTGYRIPTYAANNNNNIRLD
jgi:hypothetical protein